MLHRLAQRRPWRAALGVALLFALPVAARCHWLKPEEILAGLNHNAGLRENTGFVEARVDPKLERLLIIKVRRDKWESVPADKRIWLAQDWYDTWRHNVDAGIVAVLDVTNDQPLVHYDANGVPHLVGGP